MSSVKPRKLDSVRARSSTPEKVAKYYEKLEAVLSLNNLHDKPQHIYNLNETGLQPEHRPPNVVANTKTKCQAITSPWSTTKTLIGCVNGLGHALPSYFIFKGKRFNPDLLKGCSVGANGIISDSGWSNSQIFQQYLSEHFLPYARALYQRQTADAAYLRRSYLTQIAVTNNMGKRDGHHLIRSPSAHVKYLTTTWCCSVRTIQELLLFSLLNMHGREHRTDHYSLWYLPNCMQGIHASNVSCKYPVFVSKDSDIPTQPKCQLYASNGSVRKLSRRKPGAEGYITKHWKSGGGSVHS